MIRSLNSAVTGLKNHQVKMDVIGNNIANVNTTAFKRSRVSFATTMNQTLKAASAPTAEPVLGGINAIQMGLGVSLGAIDQIMTQGSSQSTGNDADMMIQGPGFFVLQYGNDTVYSRAGAFSLDKDGILVDPASGAQVLDDAGGPITIDLAIYSSYSIGQTGIITAIPMDSTQPAVDIHQIQIATFPNPAGLMSIGGNFYQMSTNSGDAIVGVAGDPEHTTTKIISKTVEMSNVDLSTEFTDMIVAQRGFQANSRVITVSDTLLEELINLKR